MKAGENVWICQEIRGGCGHTWKSAETPSRCPECDGYNIEPKVNMKRVTGQTYDPYYGDTIWIRSANEVLETTANQNFRNRR